MNLCQLKISAKEGKYYCEVYYFYVFDYPHSSTFDTLQESQQFIFDHEPTQTLHLAVEDTDHMNVAACIALVRLFQLLSTDLIQTKPWVLLTNQIQIYHFFKEYIEKWKRNDWCTNVYKISETEKKWYNIIYQTFYSTNHLQQVWYIH